MIRNLQPVTVRLFLPVPAQEHCLTGMTTHQPNHHSVRHLFIYAIARTESQALQIEDRLTRAGFSNDGISALIPDKNFSQAFSHLSPADEVRGIETGAATGGVLGGALGLLASIGALVIPGVGRMIAVGPLLAALGGVVNGAAAVGISGALVGLGIPEKDAKLYEHRIVGGDILISVQAETVDEVQIARDVLEKAMAEDIAITTIPSEESPA